MDKKTFLINNIFDQAEIYLKEIGEFAPFASIIDLKEEVVPIGYFSDEQEIDSLLAIKTIEENILDRISKKAVLLGAIGINVSIKVNNKKRNALLIKLTEDGINWVESYYAYNLKDNQVFWD